MNKNIFKFQNLFMLFFLFACSKEVQVDQESNIGKSDSQQIMNQNILEVSKHYQTDPNATGSLSSNMPSPPPVPNYETFSGSYDPASIPGGPLKTPGGTKE